MKKLNLVLLAAALGLVMLVLSPGSQFSGLLVGKSCNYRTLIKGRVTEKDSTNVPKVLVNIETGVSTLTTTSGTYSVNLY
jgi:hypothetical protein